MITFELNGPQFAVTSDVMAKIVELIDGDWTRDYNIVEHTDHGGRYGDVWLWAHPVEDAENTTENPVRYWITEDGAVALFEEVDWNWKGTS